MGKETSIIPMTNLTKCFEFTKEMFQAYSGKLPAAYREPTEISSIVADLYALVGNVK